MNYDTAHLLGLHAGDGTLYQTSSRSLVWELRGNLDEREFYDNHIIPLLQRLGFDLKGHFRSGGKQGCYGVRCCKREFTSILIKYGYSPGKKSVTVRIPGVVMNTHIDLKRAFLAGLFATDGSAYEQRGRPYVEVASASPGLIIDVRELLEEFDIRNYTWTYEGKWQPMHHLRISGKNQVRMFEQKIGFVNAKHRRRISQFLDPKL
jgi:hypothetical protein